MSQKNEAVVIARFTEQHLEEVTALYNNPAVARQVLQMPYQTVDMWRKRLRPDDERQCALVALQAGVVVGSCTLEQHQRIRASHVGHIGMGVAIDSHGKGIGTQLLEAALEVADNWMGLRRVELSVYTDNASAVALYHKFGFEIEGEQRDSALRDGRFVNTYVMARLHTPA